MKGEIEQYICTKCGCTSDVLENMKDATKPKELSLEDIELKKIWKVKDNTFIKIATMMGHKHFKKDKGTIYQQIKYVDFDTFEYEILDKKVDFKNLFNEIMK